MTVLRTKLLNVEKELRHERERCAILERSRNRKVAGVKFTKGQPTKNKENTKTKTIHGTQRRLKQNYKRH